MLYSWLDRWVFRWEGRYLTDTDAVLLVGQMGVQVGGKVVTLIQMLYSWLDR